MNMAMYPYIYINLFTMHSLHLYQAFLRDPDGYYIEFCSCETLEDYLTDRMAINQSIATNNDWSLKDLLLTMKVNQSYISSILYFFIGFTNQLRVY